MKLNVNPPKYNYCPFCGKQIASRNEEDKVRDYCIECKWTHYPYMALSAGAMIIRENKVLLVQRARDPYKGTWMFPAGFVDFGEHPEDTLVREVKEEVGLEVCGYELLEVMQVDDDPRVPGSLILFYKVEVTSDMVKNNDLEENSAIQWFEIDNIPKLSWHAHQIIAKKYLK